MFASLTGVTDFVKNYVMVQGGWSVKPGWLRFRENFRDVEVIDDFVKMMLRWSRFRKNYRDTGVVKIQWKFLWCQSGGNSVKIRIPWYWSGRNFVKISVMPECSKFSEISVISERSKFSEQLCVVWEVKIGGVVKIQWKFMWWQSGRNSMEIAVMQEWSNFSENLYYSRRSAQNWVKMYVKPEWLKVSDNFLDAGLVEVQWKFPWFCNNCNFHLPECLKFSENLCDASVVEIQWKFPFARVFEI